MIDRTIYTVGDGDGQTTTASRADIDVGGDAGPAAERCASVLRAVESDSGSACFDGYVKTLCQRFYADEGRPGLPPGRYVRLLLIGYFEGLDAERAIAWRAADSLALGRKERS